MGTSNTSDRIDNDTYGTYVTQRNIFTPNGLDIETLAYYKYVYSCGRYQQEFMLPNENWKQHHENILNILGINQAKQKE